MQRSMISSSVMSRGVIPCRTAHYHNTHTVRFLSHAHDTLGWKLPWPLGAPQSAAEFSSIQWTSWEQRGRTRTSPALSSGQTSPLRTDCLLGRNTSLLPLSPWHSPLLTAHTSCERAAIPQLMAAYRLSSSFVAVAIPHHCRPSPPSRRGPWPSPPSTSALCLPVAQCQDMYRQGGMEKGGVRGQGKSRAHACAGVAPSSTSMFASLK